MSSSGDLVLKGIFDKDPAAWLSLLGWPGQRVDPLEERDGVSFLADRVIRVHDPDYIGHFEFQAGFDAGLPNRIHQENRLAAATYGLPVRSAAVLLVDRADGPAITGSIERDGIVVEYDVLRIWTIPAQVFLDGPVHLLPLIVISDTRGFSQGV